MSRHNPLVIGIKGHVLALDRASGAELWRTPLKGRDFVTVIVQDAVYASTKGELYCLEWSTGSIRWHNNLKGLGLGLISIGNDPTASAEFRRLAAAAAGG